MSEFVDTHCHIQSAGREIGERGTSELWAKAPGLDVDAIIKDAGTAGVAKLICVGCDLEDSRLATDFVQEHDNCWASIGIHPHEAKLYAGQDSKLKEFSDLLQKPKVIAIGECGLDYYYGHSSPAAQEQVLRSQIELAQKYNLPLIFHVREAFEDFWRIFADYKNLRGVLHSFTDSSINLQKAINNDLFIGVNGIATFAKNPGQIAVYKSIPLDKLLLETDAPFLTPTPHRGSINQPKHISVIAGFLAELRGEEITVLGETTTNNAKKLFGI
jgi:TatD DNase family protein